MLRRSFLPTAVAWVPCQHWARTTNFIIIATSKKKLECYDKNVKPSQIIIDILRWFFLHRDAIITCIVNTLTCLIAGVLVFSILGYMAHVQETGIDDVVASGPGLVFVTYPDLVLNLPGSVLWAVIFFTMLLVSNQRYQNILELHYVRMDSVKLLIF